MSCSCRFCESIAKSSYATIMRRHASGKPAEETATVTTPEENEKTREEDAFSGPNVPLLTRLTEATGAQLNPQPGDLGKRTLAPRRRDFPLNALFIPIAMLALLGDAAVRCGRSLPRGIFTRARCPFRARASQFATDMI